MLNTVGEKGGLDGMDGLALYFDGRLREALLALPGEIKAQASEIRLRVCRPVFITVEGRLYPVLEPGGTSPLLLDRGELEGVFRRLCDFSLYAHEEEIAQGFLTLRGGHRAGLAGRAVLTDGKITGLRDISSINLRIAREVPNAAEKLLPLFASVPVSLLLAGPPLSGKTTILRDLLRQLSWETPGISLIDERGEIAAAKDGIPQTDVGERCDVLTGYPKAQGIQIALRCMAPGLIVCDEIGRAADVDAILEGANSGVKFLASIHAASMEELERKASFQALREARVFDYIVLLGGTGRDRVRQIIKVRDGP